MLAKEYTNVFDCYFSVTDETPETKNLFTSKDVHPFMPTLLIVDSQAEPLAMKTIPEFKSAPGAYKRKYQARNIFFDERFLEGVKDFIESFIDEKAK